MIKKNSLTVSDFFCGSGGWSEGLRQSGLDLQFSLDFWKPAVDSHLLNHPNSECLLMNILELDSPQKIDNIVPDTDIIVGSPPCVSFSTSNNAGKADKSLGIQLIETFLRIVLWKQSKGHLKYWAMENVPTSEPFVKDEYTWKELGLPGEGPSLKIPTREVLVASDYGSAQNRKRFVCGNFPVPEKTHKRNERLIMDVFKELGNPLKTPKIDIVDPTYPNFKLKSKDLIDHFYDTRIEQFEWEKAKRSKEDHGFMGKMDFPERVNRTCRTVMATQSASTRESIVFGATKDKNGDWLEYRLPTIREIASFMGFPINYQFEGSGEATKYKLVGNAVCPPMSAAIGKAILKAEGIEVPEFIPLKLNNNASIDLTNRLRGKKEQKSKKFKSNYARHIPYLKLVSLRVELSNRESDFDNELITWNSTLHWGSGAKAKLTRQHNSSFVELFDKLVNFENFENSLEEVFETRLSSKYELHDRFRMVSNSNHFSSDELIHFIRKQLDLFYPAEKYEKILINHSGKINLKKDEIPLRILLSFYALNKAVDKLN
jgi:DNA (cytosine-5)-methyltransferase 1